MPNIKSSKKDVIRSKKAYEKNKANKSALKTIIKKYEAALAEGNFELAAEKLRLAEKKLMQAASKGTISKNAASRKTSRLAKKLNAAKAAK